MILTNDQIKAIESLNTAGVKYDVFSDVSVEPTDASWLKAMDWARKNNFSHFLACVVPFLCSLF